MTTFLRQERSLDFDISKDTVRPDYGMEYRTTDGREVYSLVYKDEVAAVICIAYLTNIPASMQDLTEWAYPDEARVAVPYTVWSLKHGFGRSIIFEAITRIKENLHNIERVVTLSPKTEMAKRFHMANGATHIASNDESNNFEYKL